MFSFLEPTPLTLTTPDELKPYGWTTTDIWSAPLITGLYALLTHAQPFWAEFHNVISTALGGAGGKVGPMDPESARALCALILAVLFSTRTAKNFGLIWKKSEFYEFFYYAEAVLMVRKALQRRSRYNEYLELYQFIPVAVDLDDIYE